MANCLTIKCTDYWRGPINGVHLLSCFFLFILKGGECMSIFITALVFLSVFILLITILLVGGYIDSGSMESNFAIMLIMIFIALLSVFITNLIMNSF